MYKLPFTYLFFVELLFPLIIVGQSDLALKFDYLTSYEVSDEDKRAASLAITDDLIHYLELGESADSLNIRQLKIVSSPDGALSLYTWYYTLSDATAQYGGLVVRSDVKIPLYFNDLSIVENKKYTAENWCGGIYYDIIPVQKRGDIYYTLLAWDGNNGVTSKKIIDVLWFDKKGKAIFGHPLFVEDRKKGLRVVIEYAASNSLMLDYDEEQNAIVTNALYVNEEKFTDVSEYYSVSDDFNLYRFEEEEWVLYRDVDLRMNKEDSKVLMRRNSNPASGL